MKKIKLTQGKWAMVDDEDYEWINKFKWCILRGAKTSYAYRGITIRRGVYKSLKMDSMIMSPKDGMMVDHRDGNGLNNRRSNLRACSCRQNLMNTRIGKRNSSGYKGVQIKRDGRKNKFCAKIQANGKSIWLGAFYKAIDAARKYDDAAVKYYREFACLNFKRPGMRGIRTPRNLLHA